MYRKSVLNLLKYRFVVYLSRFVVNFGTLSIKTYYFIHITLGTGMFN